MFEALRFYAQLQKIVLEMSIISLTSYYTNNPSPPMEQQYLILFFGVVASLAAVFGMVGFLENRKNHK